MYQEETIADKKVMYLNEETCKKIQRNFPLIDQAIRLQPGNWFFEESALRTIEKAKNLELRTSDIIIVTYPKSGSTWLQEIVWTFLHNANLDNPLAERFIDLRSPHIEADLFLAPSKAPKLHENGEIMQHFLSLSSNLRYDELNLTLTELTKSPRVMKSHLPLSLLPENILEKSKIIYMVRNPEDVIVSRFNFNRLMKFQNFLGTFDEYLDRFFADEIYYSPYWTHILDFWKEKTHPNLLFLRYEDMVETPEEEYEKICQFLGLRLTQDEIGKIIAYTRFKNMKERLEAQGHSPMSDQGRFINKEIEAESGGFFRKGQVGKSKENFTEEQMKRFKKWVKRSTKGFPEDFPYLFQCLNSM